MSKQLTGALFVDIQGDNKNLKKSLNDSKQSVSGFATQVTSMFASNPALNFLMGAGNAAGLALVSMRKQWKGKMNFSGMKQAGTMARNRRHLLRNNLSGLTGWMGGDGEDGVDTPQPSRGEIFIARQKLKRARTAAAKEKLLSRGGRGGYLGRTSILGQMKSAQGLSAAAGIAMKAGGAFLMSGGGLLMVATIAAAAMGTIMGSAFKRGEEGRKFDVKSLREDALTKVARIKQNIQIAKNTAGQGFRGGAERYYDRQAANIAPMAATLGNVGAGSFWGFMGYLNWSIFQGGVVGGAYRWATGGDFF